jgi:Xaa-Pro aminopeptidase
MTANIEDRILLKLSPQSEAVMDTLTEGMSVSDHRKIDNAEGTFMPVHVECIGVCNLGHVYSLAHYYEQHVGVRIEDGLAVSIDETEQADMTVFAEVWLKNIRVQQGLGEVL